MSTREEREDLRLEARHHRRWCDGKGYMQGIPVCGGRASKRSPVDGEQLCQRCATRPARLLVVVERLRIELHECKSILVGIVDWSGVDHDDPECPEDDTCECANVRRINDCLRGFEEK